MANKCSQQEVKVKLTLAAEEKKNKLKKKIDDRKGKCNEPGLRK